MRDACKIAKCVRFECTSLKQTHFRITNVIRKVKQFHCNRNAKSCTTFNFFVLIPDSTLGMLELELLLLMVLTVAADTMFRFT